MALKPGFDRNWKDIIQFTVTGLLLITTFLNMFLGARDSKIKTLEAEIKQLKISLVSHCDNSTKEFNEFKRSIDDRFDKIYGLLVEKGK